MRHPLLSTTACDRFASQQVLRLAPGPGTKEPTVAGQRRTRTGFPCYGREVVTAPYRPGSGELLEDQPADRVGARLGRATSRTAPINVPAPRDVRPRSASSTAQCSLDRVCKSDAFVAESRRPGGGAASAPGAMRNEVDRVRLARPTPIRNGYDAACAAGLCCGGRVRAALTVCRVACLSEDPLVVLAPEELTADPLQRVLGVHNHDALWSRALTRPAHPPNRWAGKGAVRRHRGCQSSASGPAGHRLPAAAWPVRRRDRTGSELAPAGARRVPLG